MKPKTKIIAIVAFALAIFPTFAGGGAKKSAVRTKERTLVEQGLRLAALMKEKAESDAYLSIVLGANDSLREKVREMAAGDVSKPKEVYRMKADFAALCAFVAVSGGNPDIAESLSHALKAEFERRFLASIPMMIVAKFSGAEEIAAASIISTSATFDSDELEEDCIFIFTFVASNPVAVSFLRGEGRSVSASAQYITDRDIKAFTEEVDGLLTIEKVR